jgi:hypothetical protein
MSFVVLALGVTTLVAASAGTAVAAKKPTGKAIVFQTEAAPSAFPAVGTGMKAAAKAINDAGGVKDPAGGPNRPITIDVCDDSSGPNAAADCARKAVSEGALATVGSQTAYGAQSLPISFNAGIPFVAGGAYDVAALTSPLSFPIINSVQSTIGGFQYLGKALGLKTAWSVSVDAPQADALKPQQDAAYDQAGVKLLGTSKVSASATSTPDYTPIAAAAAGSGAQMISMDIGPGGVSVMKSLLTQGVDFHKTAVMADTNVVSFDDLKPLGSKSSGLYFIGASYPAGYNANPGVRQYNKEMDAYGDKKNPRTEASIMAWTGVHVIVDLIPKMTEITPAALVTAMQSAGQLQYGPMAPWDWAKPAYTEGLFKGLRIFSTSQMVTRVVGGKLIPIVKGFVTSDQPFTVTKAGKLSSTG